MRQSLKRARAGVLVLPPLFLAWVSGASEAATTRPVLALRPGPIDRPLSIAAADFDRDGYDDLAIANFQAGTIQILINQKDNTFAPAPQGPSGVGAAFLNSATSGPFDMVVTDLNPEDVDGDGVANTDDDCPNVFNPKDATGLQVDADGNGVGDTCEVLRDTDCDGTGDTPIDSDGDGVPEYDPGQMPPVLDNCPRLANSMQVDLDADGVGDVCKYSPDLIIVTTTQGGGVPFGAVRVRLNDGGGGLVGRPSYGSGVAPGKVVVADFTGDGRPDLTVAVSSVDVVQFLPGQADGIFGLTTVLQAGDGAQGAESGDFNGDGHLDLAVANRTADSLSIYMNPGTSLPTTPTTTVTLPPLSGPVVLLSGKLGPDPDLFADLVVVSQGRPVCVLGPKAGTECDADDDCVDPQNPGIGTCAGGAGSIQVFTGSASGALTEVQPPPMAPGGRPRAGLLLDLDGNSKLDLAVGDFTGGRVLLYSGNGDGTFAAPTVLTGTPQPSSLAALHVAGPSAGPPDLAVLDYADNRIDLYHNNGGLSFSPFVTSPASPWRGTSAMLLTGADTAASVDIVLLQRATARIDALTGIGDGTFRAVEPQPLKGPSACPSSAVNATSVIETDLRQNGRPDLAILDSADGTVTLLASNPLGVLEEKETVPAGSGAERISAGALLGTIDDYDRDCVPNVADNCPTVFNPCPVADPACALIQASDNCPDPAPPQPPCNPGDAAMLDPTTRQCDSDHNGIGDECQFLSATQGTLDSDSDSKPDFDPNALITSGGAPDFDRDTFPNATDNCPNVANDQADADMNGIGDACQTLSGGLTVDSDGDGVPTFDPAQLGGADPVGDALDNCPFIFNPGQEDNNADHVGNACVVAAALDNCIYAFNSTQADANGDGVGDFCAVPPQDLIAASPTANSVTLLSGDGSGSLHPAAASPLLGLTRPKAGVAGQFALNCTDLPDPGGVTCQPRTVTDIAVAAQGMPADPSDGSITIFKGDDLGGFAATPAATTDDDPDDLLIATAQPVCSIPNIPGNSNLRFDADNRTDTLAAVEPGLSQIEIFLPSSQDAFTMGSPLVPPPAQAQPLPVPMPLLTAQFSDLNQDGRQDLVALSSPPGGPSQIALYFSIGNGLFFTDPTFSPVTVDGEMRFLSSTNVDPDSVFPDVVLFSMRDQSPIVLTNTLRERADIDGSGRVDGFDLAILTAAFGATRGEDFILNANGTFQQTGPGCGVDYRCQLNSAGSVIPGQNLPSSNGTCNFGFDPLTGSYGLGPDVNLDGLIDGEDLAFLASEFGRRLP